MWGILGSIAGSLLTGAMNNDAASDRQEDSQAFSAQQFATRYQTTTKDMIAAGLNPMLAYQQGGGNAPVSSPASSAGYPDMGASISQARMASAQVANIAADTDNKKAQADLIAAQAAHSWASAGQSNAQTGLINETVNKVKQEVINLHTENDRSRSLIENLRVQYQNLVKEGYNLTEVGNQLRASISKIFAEVPNINEQTLRTAVERQLGELDLSAASKFGNMGREAGQLRPFFDILRGIMSMRK